jgi:hypothetical protein
MDCYDFEHAAVRLRLRPSSELADFIAGLLTEHTTGIGVYARTFAASDCVGAVQIIEDSIGTWSHLHKHDAYHQARTAAQHLGWTLDAVERCVLPHDREAAFRLIVRFFEADADLRQAIWMRFPIPSAAPPLSSERRQTRFRHIVSRLRWHGCLRKTGAATVLGSRQRIPNLSAKTETASRP